MVAGTIEVLSGNAVTEHSMYQYMYMYCIIGYCYHLNSLSHNIIEHHRVHHQIIIIIIQNTTLYTYHTRTTLTSTPSSLVM
jgi:hypothetical protein